MTTWSGDWPGEAPCSAPAPRKAEAGRAKNSRRPKEHSHLHERLGPVALVPPRALTGVSVVGTARCQAHKSQPLPLTVKLCIVHRVHRDVIGGADTPVGSHMTGTMADGESRSRKDASRS